MTTIKADPELTREIFEAAQAVRLLKVFASRYNPWFHIAYFTASCEWRITIMGYSFTGSTLLEALEKANPLLDWKV